MTFLARMADTCAARTLLLVASGSSAQRSQARANLLRKELRLFPGSEVAALVELVVVNELGIRSLHPASRGWIKLIRKDADGNRDGDAFDTEKAEIPASEPLPVEPGRGNPRIRQPGQRDVVEDVVSCEAGGLSIKCARDELQAPRVVVKQIGCQADGGICDPVKRLRTQPHLVCVADALRIHKLQALVCEPLVSREAGWRRSASPGSLIDVGWNHARHVGVNAEQFRRGLCSHDVRDNRTPVTALRDELRVAEALH